MRILSLMLVLTIGSSAAFAAETTALAATAPPVLFNTAFESASLGRVEKVSETAEIWYTKKALLAQHARQPIAFALNLHNTEMNEYLETMVDAEPEQAMMRRFFALAATKTSFDPSRPKLTLSLPGSAGPGNTTSSIWREARVPMMLLEQRIGPSRKLDRIATTDDRMTLGRELVALMAEVAR